MLFYRGLRRATAPFGAFLLHTAGHTRCGSYTPWFVHATALSFRAWSFGAGMEQEEVVVHLYLRHGVGRVEIHHQSKYTEYNGTLIARLSSLVIRAAPSILDRCILRVGPHRYESGSLSLHWGLNFVRYIKCQPEGPTLLSSSGKTCAHPVPPSGPGEPPPPSRLSLCNVPIS